MDKVGIIILQLFLGMELLSAFSVLTFHLVDILTVKSNFYYLSCIIIAYRYVWAIM